MKTVHLPIDSISIDGGTQAREIINMATVAEYAAAMEEGEALPPGVVFFDGTKHHLGDGFHRFHAHRKIGATSFECEVRTGTLLDAKLYAYGANKAHGLQRTNADKRKAVLGMLADFSDWSDRAIARHVGVTHPFVAAIRNPEVAARQADTRTASKPAKSPKVETVSTRTEKPAEVETVSTPRAEPSAPTPAAADPRESVIAEQAERIADLERIAAEINADNASMATVFEADDKLAAALAENKLLRAQVAGLRERVNGLMNEKNEAIRAAKSWQRKAEKAEKAGAAA